MDELLIELLSKHAHVVSGILFTLLGVIVGWLLGYWRRHRLKKQVAGGDIRELDRYELAQRRLVICLDVKPVPVKCDSGDKRLDSLNKGNDGKEAALRILAIQKIQFRARRSA